MQVTQKLSWFRISAESLAIVASILLAFAIDALWNNYQLQQEEQEILKGLRDEFSRHVEAIQVARRRVTRNADAIDFLLSHQGESPETINEIAEVERAVFYASFSSPGLELQGGVRDALLDSGRLEIIGDTQLRRLLAEWAKVVERSESQAVATREFVMQSLMPHLATLNVPLPELLVPIDKGGLGGPVTRQTVSPGLKSRYSQLLMDQKYLNLLAVTRWWAGGTLYGYDNTADKAQEILEYLDKNLKPRSSS